LREAAELIRKPNGEAVSFQYLSELENDHRNPPSEHLLDEIARVYKITRSYLYIQAGRIPPDFPRRSVKEPQADAIFQELRRIVEQSAAA
jgi:transcriptional regulator with XRE-family HTH domain